MAQLSPEIQARLRSIGIYVTEGCDECGKPILTSLRYIEPHTKRVLCSPCAYRLGVAKGSYDLNAVSKENPLMATKKAVGNKAAKAPALARVTNAEGNPYSSGRRRRIFNILADGAPHSAKEISEKADVKVSELPWLLEKMKKKGEADGTFAVGQKGQAVVMTRRSGGAKKAVAPAAAPSAKASGGNELSALAAQVLKAVGKKGCTVVSLKKLGEASKLKTVLNALIKAKKVIVREQNVLPAA